MHMKQLLATLTFAFFIFSCTTKKAEPLPNYGPVYIPHTFTDQNGQPLDSTLVQGKVYVADFFFTSCNTICPKMSAQLLRVQEKYEGNEDFEIVSFSIDPKRDTVGRLNWYAEKLGVDDDIWHLVTAPKEMIDETSAIMKVFQEEDASLDDGFNHQGHFLLIDQTGTLRGSYNGTIAEEVDELMEGIDQLL